MNIQGETNVNLKFKGSGVGKKFRLRAESLEKEHMGSSKGYKPGRITLRDTH